MTSWKSKSVKRMKLLLN